MKSYQSNVDILLNQCIIKTLDPLFPIHDNPLNSSVLNNLAKLDNITVTDELLRLKMTKREQLLAMHKTPIGYNEKRQRYYTRLPNNPNPIFRVHKSDIENVIVEYYANLELDNSKKCTLTTIYPEFIKYRQMNRQPATVTKDIRHFDMYIKNTVFGSCEITNISRQMYVEWAYDIITSHSMTKKYFKNVKTTLNQMISYALRYNLISSNPLRDINILDEITLFRKPEQHEKYEDAICLDNIKPLTECARADLINNPYALIINLILLTGVRVGEAIALKYKDFDAKGMKVHVYKMKSPSACNNQDEYGVVERLKKDATPRYIPINNDVLDIINTTREHNRALGFPVGDDDYIFFNNNRYTHYQTVLISDWTVRNRLYKYCESCELDYEYSPHDLRRTYASVLRYSGLEETTIQQYMGHKDIETTRTYFRTIASAKEESSKLDSALALLC